LSSLAVRLKTKKNGKQIGAITAQLADPRFVTGFGSIGGEEFFSYLNISDRDDKEKAYFRGHLQRL
jgi:hypothetical protein